MLMFIKGINGSSRPSRLILSLDGLAAWSGVLPVHGWSLGIDCVGGRGIDFWGLD